MYRYPLIIFIILISFPLIIAGYSFGSSNGVLDLIIPKTIATYNSISNLITTSIPISYGILNQSASSLTTMNNIYSIPDNYHLGVLRNGTLLLNGEGEIPLTYEDLNGSMRFQGDIDLTNNVVEGRAAVDQFVENKLWPNGIIPYSIEPAVSHKERIIDAINHWMNHTKIRFVPIVPSNHNDYPNYILFKNGSPNETCHSAIGMKGGEQIIGINPDRSVCTTGTIIHELGHAVGLWHEQSRCDRDDYVVINWQNIDPFYMNQFSAKLCDSSSDSNIIGIGKYDYCSIMEYPENAFSYNGEPTIIPKQKVTGCEMGQRQGLSQGDIDAVNNSLYHLLQK